MPLSLRQLFRTAALRLLQTTAKDITISHHWVQGAKIRVNSFKHKGYWWHGKRREVTTLESIAKIVGPEQTVFDVGANIGYFTIYLSKLVQANGKVIAFEPCVENLYYLKRNVENCENVTIDTRGVADRSGSASFYVESLTGQNNSLVENYEVFETNASRAGLKTETRVTHIDVVSLDEYVNQSGNSPAFIKMDIEGAEIDAIRGMQAVLATSRPVVLIEISRHASECLKVFTNHGYIPLDESLRGVRDEVFSSETIWNSPVNFFFVPKEMAKQWA